MAFAPDEVLLVVEVLSPSTTSTDLVTKRHQYARMGIAQYWIVDPVASELVVLRQLDDPQYQEKLVVKAGRRWSTEDPHPLSLDPADFR